MIAAVLTKPRTFEVKNSTPPEITENEVKIKVEGCGICASSIPVWQGREWFNYPLDPGSPGHEGWGIVEKTGKNVTKVKAGDRVAFLSNHSFAEYDISTEGSLVKLPESIAGQPFPAEPLGCAMNIFERSNISKGDTVAIIGIGFLGALLCQLAKNAKATVIAISRRPFSLDYAKQYGADHQVPFTSSWEVANHVSELTSGRFCERVIEATGKQEGIDLATEIIAEGGRLIIAGYHQDGLRQVNMQKWNWKGIDVINAHERASEKYLTGMENAVKAVQDGILQPANLYTDLLSINELNRGFELTDTRPDGFMKALITF
ncbi:MAG: MDR/zinc-dependent alcohol dehydrogenase-like family protein [Candidatus Dadabacteria bacterium]